MRTEAFEHYVSVCHRWFLELVLIAARKGRQRLLSACVRMWTESHKFCKVWAIINQFLIRFFLFFYGVWLTSQFIKPVWICESVDINQSIWMNQFYAIEASNFILIQYLQLTWGEFVIRSKKGEICAVA